MESRIPAPNASPEASMPRINYFLHEQSAPNSPEKVDEVKSLVEKPVETIGANVQSQAMAVALPKPIAVDQGAVSSKQPVMAANNPSSNSPSVAGDNDKIEKAWVDKAKSIVVSTKNDPYQQEKEVGRLQADYLKKRYGKDIRVASD